MIITSIGYGAFAVVIISTLSTLLSTFAHLIFTAILMRNLSYDSCTFKLSSWFCIHMSENKVAEAVKKRKKGKKWGNRGPEQFIDFPKASKLKGGRAVIQTQACVVPETVLSATGHRVQVFKLQTEQACATSGNSTVHIPGRITWVCMDGPRDSDSPPIPGAAGKKPPG